MLRSVCLTYLVFTMQVGVVPGLLLLWLCACGACFSAELLLLVRPRPIRSQLILTSP